MSGGLLWLYWSLVKLMYMPIYIAGPGENCDYLCSAGGEMYTHWYTQIKTTRVDGIVQSPG
jgi:hypothetical protein